MKRALLMLLLCGCQAISGLDDLRFVSADGGQAQPDTCAADGCEPAQPPDAASCSPAIAGASCDLIAQCGCTPYNHCALLSVQAAQPQVGCSPDREPLRKPGAACNAESECPAGYSCWRGLCEQYCTLDADCPSGQCVPLRDGAEIAGVRVCSVACDFANDSGCQNGTRCAHTPDGRDYCIVPRMPCPFVNDGVCDEPQGSRICVSGSDSVDCT